MEVSPAAPVRRPWWSLWFTALASLIAQLALCQFFSFGQRVPLSIDVNPSNLWKYAYQFPPGGEYLTLNWLGIANLPPTLNPFSIAAHLSAWLFFTAYAPVMATLTLLAMAAFLRELNLARPAALFGGVIYAWQGDLLPFVFPGHYGYIATWPFFAIAAWGAIRAQRTRHWAGSLLAGAGCGMMVGLQPDRGAIASLLIAAFYLGPIFTRRISWKVNLPHLVLCAGVALLVSLGAFLSLFKGNIVGVKLGGITDREQAFILATQYSLGPAETLTYLAPGLFGWHNTSPTGPYWGWIGQTPDWQKTHRGLRNQNLAISTTGTVASVLALLGICLLLPGAPQRFFGSSGSPVPRPAPTVASSSGIRSPWGPRRQGSASGQAAPSIAPEMLKAPILTDRQIYFGRLLLILGTLTLVLSWGYHTPLYRPLFGLPLMDKWRNPLKWLEIANFAFVVLSAFGVQYLLRSLRADDAPPHRPLQLFFGLVTGLLGVSFLASYPIAILVADNLSLGGYNPPEIASVMHTLHLSLGFAFVLTGATWLLLIGAWRAETIRQWEIVNPWIRRGWQCALTPEHVPATLAGCLSVIGALQLGWVAAQFIEPVSLAQLTATNPLLQSLKSEGPLVRVAVPAPQDPILNTLLQYQFAGDRISSVDISAASRLPDRLAAFLNDFQNDPERFWFLTGVKNVALAQNVVPQLQKDPVLTTNIEKADGYTLMGDGDEPSHALVRLKDYLAKATFVLGAETIPEAADQLKRLVDPKWDPRKTVLLSEPFTGMAMVKASPNAPPAQVKVTSYSAHEIDLDVTTSFPGYVLINDEYDPDWQTEINGKPAPLLRADYILRAIPIATPGEAKIVLRYVPQYRLGGMNLPVLAMNLLSDAIMLAAFLLGGLALVRTKPRETSIVL